ncbi:hypothetical protein [Jiangella asiatica]|uniref:Uncharacterized protein n=1 Tax=Jiangella asiatica TaxID=2530372 RepID=A0A4R5DI07_9ACTN|nr:hypothetical protein [Jiangella asiatica]TDE10385.1 hypothetical protein E1269_11865 [Jiangella asiatica]
MGSEPAVRKISRVGVGWRLGVTAVALTVLTFGQLHDTNDYFPLGSLSQYATPRDMDGTVRSVYMLADTTGGDQVRVPLNPGGVGVGRADIESQLDRIVADPSLLQGIADAWSELHPEADPYVRLYVMRDTFQLEDGLQQGTPTTEELTTWEVRR